MSLFNKRTLSRGIGLKNQSKEFNKFLDEFCDKLEVEIVSTGETFKDDHQLELGDIFEIVGKDNLYVAIDEEDGDAHKFYFMFFEKVNRKLDDINFLYADDGKYNSFIEWSETYWENEHTLKKETEKIKKCIENWK